MTEASTKPGCLDIEGEMTIYRAAELKPAIFNALGATQQLDIRLAEVSEMDTSGVQLLILAQREAEAAGKRVRLLAPSEAVREVFELYRLADRFSAATNATPSSDGTH
jgi:anti-anti-sigma factor